MVEGELGYLRLLKDVLENGSRREDRTGVGTVSVFGRQLRFDLRLGFPAVTTKRLAFKSVVAELLWFLRGDTNVRWLRENGCTIWDEWADANGELGPVYGKQWRKWETVSEADDRIFTDQIAGVISSIREDPNSRRHVVSAWNVSDLPRMALAPCHSLFQFYVSNGELSCQLYQRSADLFLGVPFNIASYALLTHMVAQVTGLKVGEFVHSFGDVHIYSNHIDQVGEQLSREVRKRPTLAISSLVTEIDGFSVDDFRLVDYEHHPAIHADVAR